MAIGSTLDAAGRLGAALPMSSDGMRDTAGAKESMLEPGATLTCRCEEILLEEIVGALAAGAQTVDDVKRRTRAGMGACQGIYCVPVIAAMAAQATGVPVDRVAGSSMSASALSMRLAVSAGWIFPPTQPWPAKSRRLPPRFAPAMTISSWSVSAGRRAGASGRARRWGVPFRTPCR